MILGATSCVSQQKGLFLCQDTLQLNLNFPGEYDNAQEIKFIGLWVLRVLDFCNSSLHAVSILYIGCLLCTGA